jgi:hypothetical protein
MHTIRIPWAELSGPDIARHMDTATRRRLIEEWSEVDICDPMF